MRELEFKPRLSVMVISNHDTCYKIVLLTLAALVSCPTLAFALDCTAIKTTSMPYQVKFLRNSTNTYAVQIFRGRDLMRQQVSVVNDSLFKVTFQANFQLENPGINGEKIRIIYSVPTNQYIWTQGTLVVHGKSVVDGTPSSGPGFEAKYTMLPDEVFGLGNCSFLIKHYRLRQASPGIDMKSEVWFSTELNTALRTTISTQIVSTGKMTQTELDAKSIETVFKPFQ